MKSAMITVEVLISMVILFMITVTSVVVVKQMNFIQNKQQKHEKYFIELFNVKEQISYNICEKFFKLEGVSRDFYFIATCNKIESLNNYQKSLDSMVPEGNVGNYIVSLYQITLELKRDNFHKKYTYYKTVIAKK